MKTALNVSPPLKVKISGGFVFILALLLFLDEENVLLAALPSVVVHELCHIGAMRIFGGRATALSLSLSGLSLDYAGVPEGRALVFTALSGPLGGALLALICARLGEALGSEYLLLCAGTGFVLSLFNLLPALPLDGGRALRPLLSKQLGEAKSSAVMKALGSAVSFLVIICGGLLCIRGKGAALLLAGLWLGAAQIKHSCK